jgi:Tol biopolymer transport system component
MRRFGGAAGRNASSALAAALVAGGLLVTSLAQARAPAYLTFITNSRTLHPSVEVANLNGGNPRKLGPGMSAIVAPSGNFVAAIRLLPPQDNATSELLTYSTRGGATRRLYHYDGFLTLVGWSSDSKLLLAYGSDNSNSGPLLVIDAASGAVTTIARGVVEGACFAPNASDDVVYALAKSLLGSAPINLFISSADGSSRRRLTGDGHSFDPIWGAREIVFARSRSRGEQDEAINQLWSIAPSGRDATQLTHMSVGPLVAGLVPVAVSATGEHVLADFEGTDTSAAWTVSLGGKATVARALNGVTDGDIPDALSRDGGTVLITKGFVGASTSVESIRWAGGEPTVLSAHGANASWNE